MSEGIKAGIYARISLDTAGEGLGTQRQIDLCTEKAKALGWTVTDTYKDDDISASSGKERPQYNRLLKDLEAGVIDAVVVYAWDRLTRRMADLVGFIELQRTVGFQVGQVTGDVDLSSAAGVTNAYILGSIAQGEAMRMAERVRAQQRQYAQQGRKHQGIHRVFGYDRDFNQIESEAAVVREVFDRKSKGESLTSIAHDLNTRGITTVKTEIKNGKNAGKTVGGGTWDASKVSSLIRRHDYIGEITIKGEVVGKAKFEPIVDRPIWETANEHLEANNNRGKNTRKSLLSGFLICGTCLTKMKQGRGKDGIRYYCPSPRQTPSACGSNAITGEKTDSAVFNAAWGKEQELQFAGNLPKKAEPVRDFKAEQQAIQDEIDQTHALRESGSLQLVDAVPILNDLRAKLAKVMREEAAYVVSDFGVLQLFFDWEEWNLSQKRVWLGQYVKYAVVTKAQRVGIKGWKPERITVHFKDGTSLRLSLGVVVDQSPNAPKKAVPVCAEDDCTRKTYSKGLCQTHYKSAWRRAKRATKQINDTE